MSEGYGEVSEDAKLVVDTHPATAELEAPESTLVDNSEIQAPHLQADLPVYLPPALEMDAPSPSRRPNFFDALVFFSLLAVGFVVSVCGLGIVLYFHLFGLHSPEAVAKSTPVSLVTELVIYAVALAGAVPIFSMIWRQGFFTGLHWHGATVRRFPLRLIATAVGCNLLALVGDWIVPFPQHAPIDQMFGSPSDAWLLAGFGVLVAPFFEEMIFRGFLLPAIATAWDWCMERIYDQPPRPLDSTGNPVWSGAAMVASAALVSAPFALMHSPQLAAAWGPLLLLYCVSLVLSTVRLTTRSLAASTLVHAVYNFVLFAGMFAGTDGFRHMDKM